MAADKERMSFSHNGSTEVLDYCDDVTQATNASNYSFAASETAMDRAMTWFCAVCYILIFLLGWLGNGLVIYVVLRYAKMKTVTNMYILNLAVSDALFIVSLPFLTTTSILKHWIFGFAMCKIYFVLVSINLFTGVFTLAVMSADRYLAVCHPIRSMKYRTTRIALFLCLCIWSVSFCVMLPVILYSNTVLQYYPAEQRYTCTIVWPRGQPIPADMAFIWYSFILGFAIPVSLIGVFYVLVVLRLGKVGPTKKSKEKKKSNRRVTRLVLTVISVYVICWLPYWVFQVYITFLMHEKDPLPKWQINLFNGFTVLTFANSMLNPVLYAFLSDNFRKSFIKAFKCASPKEVNKALGNENSMFPKNSQTYTKSCAATTEERMELSAFENNSKIRFNSCDDANCSNATQSTVMEDYSGKAFQDEQGFLKPPVVL